MIRDENLLKLEFIMYSKLEMITEVNFFFFSLYFD